MKRSWVAFTQNTFSHQKLSRASLWLPAIILTISTTSAQATYQYTYTGNTFNTSSFTPDFGESCNPDELGGLCTTIREEYVSVKFTSPTLLSGGISLPTNFSYTMSTNDRDYSSNYYDLAYPYIYPYPPDSPPPDFYEPPNYFGTFNILSVSPNGLPTDWDILIYNNYYNGHDTIVNNIRTSTNQDSTSGSFSRFEIHDGQLDNAPGKWTVSAVPEPSTYVLLLSGLGLIAFSAKRRSNITCEYQVAHIPAAVADNAQVWVADDMQAAVQCVQIPAHDAL